MGLALLAFNSGDTVADGIHIATDIPMSSAALKTSGTLTASGTGSVDSKLAVATDSPVVSGGFPTMTGTPTPTPAASSTASSAPAGATGAAGRVEVGFAAVVAGLVAVGL